MREKAIKLITCEHRGILAMTKMHGARRRVELKIHESASQDTYSVTTLDGFALSILNRWRTSLGYSKPIHAVCEESEFRETSWGIDADFQRILTAATQLLQYKTIKRIIGQSYPLIIIDEFQDCHGPLLEFIKALSGASSLLLAADDFQSLDTSI